MTPHRQTDKQWETDCRPVSFAYRRATTRGSADDRAQHLFSTFCQLSLFELIYIAEEIQLLTIRS